MADHADVVAITFTATLAALSFFINLLNWKTKSQKKEECNALFNSTVEKLTSTNLASQLSAAVLLRKFFNLSIKENGEKFLFKDTLGVITGMLKVLPTGVYQKALGDGLAYARDLSFADLQKSNLQNIYLGVKKKDRELKKDEKIILNKTDFYLADLSEALIENVYGEAIFYDALLCKTKIKNSDLSGANFRNSDLRDATFVNVQLKDADFKYAKNIPEEIEKCLNSEGIFTELGIFPTEEELRLAQEKAEGKKHIFISMPGTMLNPDESIAMEWNKYLKYKFNVDIEMYKRDHYPQFGQLSSVRKKIDNADALICLGTKQIHVTDASFRPNSKDALRWNDRWLSTPWCEIEIAMAFMKGIPILLVVDDDIDVGIFDKIITEMQIQRISMSTVFSDLDKNSAFRLWASHLEVSRTSCVVNNPQDGEQSNLCVE